MAQLDKYKTLTDMTFQEVLVEMKRILPPAAYKAVGTNSRLTDINPAYLTEVATRVFGPVGIGWSFDYDAIETRDAIESTRNGDRAVTIADIYKLSLKYAYVDDNGSIRWSEPILATGNSKNSDRGHAVRGALTNAIGAAFSKLLWQLKTYKGIVDHNNAREMYDKQKERDAKKKANGSKPVQEEEPEEVPVTADVEVGHEVEVENEPFEEEGSPVVAPKETEKSDLAEKINVSEDYKIQLEIASKLVIPDGIGIPMAGSSLGEVVENPLHSEPILTFLAGERVHKKTNEYLKTNTPEMKALQHAARILLQDLRDRGVVAKQRKAKQTSEA